MKWLETNSKAIQALAGIITAVLALLALIGVKMQIDASFESQREQSARDIYREFLNVSISNPDYAQPDYCTLANSAKRSAYESYVDYLFYAAEQSLEMDPQLKPVFTSHLAGHADYLCSQDSPNDYQGLTKAMLDEFKLSQCSKAVACN